MHQGQTSDQNLNQVLPADHALWSVAHMRKRS